MTITNFMKMVSKTLSFCLFVLLLQFAKGQTNVSFIGSIIDSVSGEAIPYCNCYLKHSQKGTISNNNGFFTLKVNPKFLPDTLVISSVGFTKKEIACTKKSFTNKNIKLIPTTKELKSVVVKAEKFDWEKFIEEILDKRLDNYYKTPQISSVYFKSTMTYNNKECQKIEVAAEVLTPTFEKTKRAGSFSPNIKERFFIKGLRYTDNGKINPHPENLDQFTFFNYNYLSGLLNDNIYLYRNGVFEKHLKKLKFSLKSIDTTDNETFFTFQGTKSTHNSDDTMNIVIGMNSKAIYSCQLKSHSETSVGEDILLFNYTFREKDGKIVPVYMSFISTETNIITDKTSSINEEALFYDIKTIKNDSIPNLIEIDTKKGLEFQNIKYDKNFWDNYTIIE